jgi:DNA-binding response OmpR family regulator
MTAAHPAPVQSAARVLVVVDQPVLAHLVALTLNHGVYVTETAVGFDEAAGLLRTWQPHLIVVDMETAGEPLLARLAEHEARAARVPVVALTRRGDLRTKLAAFEQGVDDILTVPFSPEELVARVLALMRRTYREAIAFSPTLRLGELEIDILNRSVRVGGHELQLTSLEQSLLYLLAANAGRVMTRDEILDNIWGVDFAADSNLVDQHIRSLRARLQDDWRHPRFIATVPGKGYRFLPTFERKPQTERSA